MAYSPPKMITNNASPILSADLAYEAHGKCGATWVINTSSRANGIFNATETTSKINGWKVVFVHDTTVKVFIADNMNTAQSDMLGSIASSVIHPAGSEIMADISIIEIDDRADSGLAIIYRDCTQS